MLKRLIHGSLLLKLFMAILFFPACSGPKDVEEKTEPPILSMEVAQDWDLAGDCILRQLNERTKTGVLHMPSSNAIRPDWQAKDSFITIRTASDMNTLYTMHVIEKTAGHATVTATPYAPLVRNAYTDGLEVAMRQSVESCATPQ